MSSGSIPILSCNPWTSSDILISILGNLPTVVGSFSIGASTVGSLSGEGSVSTMGSLSGEDSISTMGSLSGDDFVSTMGSLSGDDFVSTVGSVSGEDSISTMGSLSIDGVFRCVFSRNTM